MDLRDSHTYDAPIDAVLALLGDPTATVAKYESMKHRDVQVLECSADADRLRVRSSRVVDVELPGFAKQVLRPTNTMNQTDEWLRQSDGSWRGTFDVVVQGAPIHIAGTMRLVPLGAQTVHEVALTVSVKIPLIGGRIADWAGKGDVRRSLDGEFSFNDEWLLEHATSNGAPGKKAAKHS